MNSLGAWVARARLQARFGRPMPTKTTSPSLSSAAARNAIFSDAVGASVAIVDPRRHARLCAQPLHQPCAQLLHVRGAVGHAEHEGLKPVGVASRVARDLFPLDVEFVVAVVVALHEA